ncbi:hypothetical protein ACFSTC_25145 [Nonomuraea ferruginea]
MRRPRILAAALAALAILLPVTACGSSSEEGGAEPAKVRFGYIADFAERGGARRRRQAGPVGQARAGA